MAQISIIGLGLIGGSLGMALKSAKGKSVQIVGYDRDWGAGGKAQRRGAIDRSARSTADAVREAHMVIIATPVLAIRRVMEEIAPHLPEGCIVTDTGSTKATIIEWAKELLPPSVNFVGGHPMAGKEESGIDAADATLFRDRPYCVVPSVDASEGSVMVVTAMAKMIGARPLYLDPVDHDQFVAAVSHMPMVTSTALFSLARSSASWSDLAAVAGPAFRDLTRLAAGSPEMNHDICLTNREAVTHWIDRMIEELNRYRNMITGNTEELYETFVRAQMDREVFMNPKQPEPSHEIPSSADQLMTMIMGERMARRTKELLQDFPELLADKMAEDLGERRERTRDRRRILQRERERERERNRR